jgi:formylglycine-generating enzyme required for sulfatase activity
VTTKKCLRLANWKLLALVLLSQSALAEEVVVSLPGGVPLTLVKVPAGTFSMGSPEGERGNVFENEIQHQVTLTRDYYLSETEVTMEQWGAVTETPMPTECDEIPVGRNRPVTCVNWNQIAGPGGFMEKLNEQLGTTEFRLPTEAEWERAARAGTTTRFAHGDVLECDDECGGEACANGHYLQMWYCGHAPLTCIELDPDDPTQCLSFVPVGAREVGETQPNPFGLYDMHGNVWEWVQDRYGEYSPEDVTDPTGPSEGTDRVIRGGDWGSEARLARSASRIGVNPSTSGFSGAIANQGGLNGFGFRVAISSVKGLGFQINAGLNDAWYNPATAGQGFLITVFPDIQQMFLAWFTYDTERPPEDVQAILGDPGHRWLTAQGPYSGDTANLTIYLTEGGAFNAVDPPATTNPAGDGSLTIEFADCNSALATYQIISLGISGEIPLERIASDNVPLCETLANP